MERDKKSGDGERLRKFEVESRGAASLSEVIRLALQKAKEHAEKEMEERQKNVIVHDYHVVRLVLI